MKTKTSLTTLKPKSTVSNKSLKSTIANIKKFSTEAKNMNTNQDTKKTKLTIFSSKFEKSSSNKTEIRKELNLTELLPINRKNKLTSAQNKTIYTYQLKEVNTGNA